MVARSSRPATYEDLVALPTNVTGQIVAVAEPGAGSFSTSLRSTSARTSSFVPNLAGWCRERMPEMPVDKPWFELAPDWICEILSPSTSGFDRGAKRSVYHAHKIAHLCFVDPEAKTLEILIHEPRG
ncbi:Uma2 family endonuclease [soil metagenome]